MVSFWYEQYVKDDDCFENVNEEMGIQNDLKPFLQHNFLQLNIQFNMNTYTIQNDVAAYQLDSLGAQAGEYYFFG